MKLRSPVILGLAFDERGRTIRRCIVDHADGDIGPFTCDIGRAKESVEAGGQVALDAVIAHDIAGRDGRRRQRVFVEIKRQRLAEPGHRPGAAFGAASIQDGTHRDKIGCDSEVDASHSHSIISQPRNPLF